MKPYPVWDIPTRLFHWALASNFLVSWLSFEMGRMQVHLYAGYTMLSLLLFRIAWGFLGSRHSRFSDFVRGPAAALRYLRNGTNPTPGHNPLGGWSVLALLGLLLAQGVSGLFNADTEGTRAPYHHLLSEQQANWVGLVHQRVFDALLVLVALHLLAVAFHTRFRNEPLLAAMIRGHASKKNGEAAPVSWGRALTVMLLSAGAVTALVYYAPRPPAAVYF